MSGIPEGLHRILLDTAPVIYFVEKHPVYWSVLAPVFNCFETGELVAVTSPITLAECLVLPMRQGRRDSIDTFVEILGGDHASVFVPIQRETARIAAGIRSRYKITLTDAFQVATALEGGCDAMLTNDKELCRVTDLKIVLVEDLQ